MPGPQVFRVLTEFRFDIAHAVANSQTLQGEVGKISAAADQANFALKRVGMGLVAQMGLGQGGFLGAIYTALKASDKFSASQRQIANIFLSNNMFEGAFAFETAMGSAAGAMENMKKAAREFSLPVSDLVNTSKLIGAALVNHGLDDSSLTRSTNLARGFLKSAPTLGIDPGLAQGQLLDAVMGRANMGDTLVQRLFNETDAMKQFAPKPGAKQQVGGGAALFNALEAGKRVEVLSKALLQFGSNSRILEENTRSLSGQLQRLSDNITGMFSVLKPIGDALMRPVKMVLAGINQFIENDGEKIVANFSKIVRMAFKDPEQMFVSLQQARRFQGDVKSAGNMLALISAIHGINWALKALGIQLQGGILMTGLRALGRGLAAAAGWFISIGGLTFIFKALSFALTKVLFPLTAITFLFQILSRAMAKAQVANAKWLAGNLEKISALFARVGKAVSNIFLPFTMILEFWSDLISWFFKLELTGNILLTLFGGFTSMLEGLGAIIVGTLSIISGAMSVVMGVISDVMSGSFRGIGKNVSKNFMDGFNEIWSRRFQREGLGVGEGSTSNKVTNIDKIEINNQFKEQMEPDRIAFVLKEQLVKAALNPQQASGRSLRSGLVAQ